MATNYFLQSSIRAVNRNGVSCSYLSVATGTYDVETGSVSNTETPYTVVMYRANLRTNQYSYPTLVGKDVSLFYLANNALLFTPAVKDKIIYNGNTYTVDSLEEHMAHSEIILYKIIAIRT
jgi:hypothetical protein